MQKKKKKKETGYACKVRTGTRHIRGERGEQAHMVCEFVGKRNAVSTESWSPLRKGSLEKMGSRLLQVGVLVPTALGAVWSTGPRQGEVFNSLHEEQLAGSS